MWNPFKRKKVESQSNELIDILVNYIDKTKRLNWTDEEVKQKFKEKNYPESLIDLAFNIYEVKGGKKMIKKHKEEELDSEDLEEESEEEDEEREEPEKPVKKFVKPVKEVEETPKEVVLTDEQIKGGFANLDSRVTQLEATLYRLKGI